MSHVGQLEHVLGTGAEGLSLEHGNASVWKRRHREAGSVCSRRGGWSCLHHLLEWRVQCAWGGGDIGWRGEDKGLQGADGPGLQHSPPHCWSSTPTGRVALSEALLGVWRGSVGLLCRGRWPHADTTDLVGPGGRPSSQHSPLCLWLPPFPWEGPSSAELKEPSGLFRLHLSSLGLL